MIEIKKGLNVSLCSVSFGIEKNYQNLQRNNRSNNNRVLAWNWIIRPMYVDNFASEKNEAASQAFRRVQRPAPLRDVSFNR